MSQKSESPSDPRRALVLVIAIALGLASAWMAFQVEQSGSVKAITSALGRIALVMGALWLAWPTLRRPASWFPPGVAMFGVVMLGVIATQPRTVLILAPAFVGLLVLASVLRTFRK